VAVNVGKRGKAGLRNLGHSCYLNSTLQCLSHVPLLAAYFLSTRHSSHLNSSSKDGTGGQLVKEFINLAGDLWFGNKAVVDPSALKSVLGRVRSVQWHRCCTPSEITSSVLIRSEYAGFEQHDAHEVIEVLIDKVAYFSHLYDRCFTCYWSQLHEDVNLVKKKPYVERPEGDGTNDGALAADAWNKHKLREDSAVQDICGSQMLSKLTCLECGHVSVCFEFQQTVPIAIPRNHTRHIRVCFVPSHDSLGHVLFPVKGSPTSSKIVTDGLCRLRAECMRPLLMNIEVDTLSPVNKLMNEAMTMISRKSVVKDFDVSSELESASGDEEDNVESVCGSMYRVGDLLLYQAKSIKAKAAKEFTLEPTLHRQVTHDEIIARLPAESSYYIYSGGPSNSCHCFVLQVFHVRIYLRFRRTVLSHSSCFCCL
jgi:hypothetical protein